MEDGLLSGVALLDHVRPAGSMGVDIGEPDNDGNPALSVTALTKETFPLFRDQRQGAFRDVNPRSGLAKASQAHAGRGNMFADFDNNGHVDLFTAKSHVNPLIADFEPFPYKQPHTVFQNL